MNHILNQYLPFFMKILLFCLFWTLFGQFLGTFPIQPVLIIPWLLNWIIFWIELPEFILNWIIFWIESPEFILNWIIVWTEFWVSNIELNHPSANIELNQIGYRPPLLLWQLKKSQILRRLSTSRDHNVFWGECNCQRHYCQWQANVDVGINVTRETADKMIKVSQNINPLVNADLFDEH